MIASTNDAIADEPAHSEIRKPIDATSPCALVRMSATVGSMIVCTTLGLKMVRQNAMILSCTAVTMCGPNQSPTKPRLPSRPSSSGGSDSVCQNAASAASEKMLPCHALASVRLVNRHAGRPRSAASSVTDGAGGWSSGGCALMMRSSMLHRP